MQGRYAGKGQQLRTAALAHATCRACADQTDTQQPTGLMRMQDGPLVLETVYPRQNLRSDMALGEQLCDDT